MYFWWFLKSRWCFWWVTWYFWGVVEAPRGAFGGLRRQLMRHYFVLRVRHAITDTTGASSRSTAIAATAAWGRGDSARNRSGRHRRSTAATANRGDSARSCSSRHRRSTTASTTALWSRGDIRCKRRDLGYGSMRSSYATHGELECGPQEGEI